MSEPLLRLGVSACLLGDMVRHDGGHQRNRYLTEVLGGDIEWVRLCPEVEIGMGVPRPSVRLEAQGDGVRMVDPVAGTDYTAAMNDWSRATAKGLQNLDGFVLKKDSPTCGPDRVRLYRENIPQYDGQGLFAAALSQACPWLPLIDDGRLHDPGLREGFLDHAMWMRRWRDAGGETMSTSGLMVFHRDHKITYLSHDGAGAKRLGQLAASGQVEDYRLQAAEVMGTPATPGRNANALQHMAGFLSDGLEPRDRAELADSIDEYREGILPLLVPLALIQHHARRDGPDWLRGQTYLNPYPKEWRLRLGL